MNNQYTPTKQDLINYLVDVQGYGVAEVEEAIAEADKPTLWLDSDEIQECYQYNK